MTSRGVSGPRASDYCLLNPPHSISSHPTTIGLHGLLDLNGTAGLQGGGVRINNKQVKDDAYCLEDSDLIDGRLVLLAAGKKNKLLLHVN